MSFLWPRIQGGLCPIEKALDWLNGNEQITPTAEDYLESAIIQAAARKQGSIVELPDCLIAAVAIRLDLALVTGIQPIFKPFRKPARG
jgi:predicted nucleic acid-binding protein